MVEPPNRNPRWKSISLVILLTELAANHSLLTRKHFRRFYKNPVTIRFADRHFATIAGSKTATFVSAARIKRDIRALEGTTKKIKKLVDKVIAHTEEDRRKVPHIRYGQIDTAIDLLEAVFRRYYLLLNGRCLDPNVPLHDSSVTEDLKRIWP